MTTAIVVRLFQAPQGADVLTAPQPSAPALTTLPPGALVQGRIVLGLRYLGELRWVRRLGGGYVAFAHVREVV